MHVTSILATYDDSVSQHVCIEKLVGSTEISESSESEVVKLVVDDNAVISHRVQDSTAYNTLHSNTGYILECQDNTEWCHIAS